LLTFSRVSRTAFSSNEDKVSLLALLKLHFKTEAAVFYLEVWLGFLAELTHQTCLPNDLADLTEKIHKLRPSIFATQQHRYHVVYQRMNVLDLVNFHNVPSDFVGVLAHSGLGDT